MKLGACLPPARLCSRSLPSPCSTSVALLSLSPESRWIHEDIACIRTMKARGLALLDSCACTIPRTVIIDAPSTSRVFNFGEPELANIVSELRQAQLAGVVDLALRTSYSLEDTRLQSRAGEFSSILPVRNTPKALLDALRTVRKEYRVVSRNEPTVTLELVVQEYVARDLHGVAITCDPVSGDPDYATVSTAQGKHDVTSGRGDARTCFVRGLADANVEVAFGQSHMPAALLAKLMEALEQVRTRYEADIDVEFGVAKGIIIFFQARPLAGNGVKPKAIARFHECVLSDIPPRYKDIFRRYRRKRHIVYQICASAGAEFPRSAVIHRSRLDSGRFQPVLRTRRVLVPRTPTAIPTRKEDFVVVCRERLTTLKSQSPQHYFLATEYPEGRFSGYAAVEGGSVIVEWIRGPIGHLIRGETRVNRCRVTSAERSTQIDGPDVSKIATVARRLDDEYPGAVLEWIDEETGHGLWTYDASLGVKASVISDDDLPLRRPAGTLLHVSADHVSLIRKLITRPLSVIAESEELSDLFTLNLESTVSRTSCSVHGVVFCRVGISRSGTCGFSSVR